MASSASWVMNVRRSSRLCSLVYRGDTALVHRGDTTACMGRPLWMSAGGSFGILRNVHSGIVRNIHFPPSSGKDSQDDSVDAINKELNDVFGGPVRGMDAPSSSPVSTTLQVDDPFMVVPPEETKVQSTSSPLTHVDTHGRVKMVDVSGKQATTRVATASARVVLGPIAFRQVAENSSKKGDVLATARIAGISAAKATSNLIPLCHSVSLSHASVDLTLEPTNHSVSILAEAVTTGQTGVEMEALTAASVAALTLYDMCKGADKGIVIQKIQLERKTGGKSGEWNRAST